MVLPPGFLLLDAHQPAGHTTDGKCQDQYRGPRTGYLPEKKPDLDRLVVLNHKTTTRITNPSAIMLLTFIHPPSMHLFLSIIT